MTDMDNNLLRNVNIFQDQKFTEIKDAKCVEINDIWEKFRMKFSVFYPCENFNKSTMHIIGNIKAIGEDRHAQKMPQ